MNFDTDYLSLYLQEFDQEKAQVVEYPYGDYYLDQSIVAEMKAVQHDKVIEA